MTRCSICHRDLPIAVDETAPTADELTVDARGVIRPGAYVCGACLDAAEDELADARALTATVTDDQILAISDGTSIEPGADIIDLRDVTERVDELREARDDYDEIAASHAHAPAWERMYPERAAELAALEALLDELRGYGDDHQWNGDWYPGSLIADEYFETYARELAEDHGAVPCDLSWPVCHIDWKAAAAALKDDYSQVEYGGYTYWYR